MTWIDPILLPLARLAIRQGWLFKRMEAHWKRAYVKAAISLGDDGATDSKISIMTGLQRRDVAALRGEAAPKVDERQPLAEIIATWWNDPDIATAGLPIKGPGVSFEAMARTVRQDVHPRTFLNILIENGAVTETEGTVSLKTRSYRPLPGSEDQLAYLSENVGDHLETAVANVAGGRSKYDMAVHYKGLSAEAIETLEAEFRHQMSQTLQKLDAMAREFPDSDDGPFRFRAGGYFYDDVKQEAERRDT